MSDSAVTLAVIAAISAAIVGLLAFATSVLGVWNTQRLFRNQRAVAEQQRAWDIEDRQERHNKTLKAVEDGTAVAKSAYVEANHVNEKIEDLHKEIKAVLTVAESVKNDTGGHNHDRAERP